MFAVTVAIAVRFCVSVFPFFSILKSYYAIWNIWFCDNWNAQNTSAHCSVVLIATLIPDIWKSTYPIIRVVNLSSFLRHPISILLHVLRHSHCCSREPAVSGSMAFIAIFTRGQTMFLSSFKTFSTLATGKLLPAFYKMQYYIVFKFRSVLRQSNTSSTVFITTFINLSTLFTWIHAVLIFLGVLTVFACRLDNPFQPRYTLLASWLIRFQVDWIK